MTRSRPRIPGLTEEWAEHQLELPALECTEVRGGRVRAHVVEPLEPACGSCTMTMTLEAQAGRVMWDCDPERPGCPLHEVPEQSR